jgi:hypothetical protein
MDRPTRELKIADTATPLPPIDDSGTVDREAIRYAARAAADLKRATMSEYKESMEEEAKKITSVYREVQQKHDLAMKLEQVMTLSIGSQN